MKCLSSCHATAMLARSLAENAKSLPSSSVKANIYSSIRKVESLLPEDQAGGNYLNHIDILKPLVRKWYETGELGELISGRNLRILAYLLDSEELAKPSLLEAGKVPIVLEYMHSHWRDSFLTPLIVFILRHYFDENIAGQAVYKAARVVEAGLTQYSGSRSIPMIARAFQDAIFVRHDPGVAANSIKESNAEWFQFCEAKRFPLYVQGTSFFGFAFTKYLLMIANPEIYLEDIALDHLIKLGDPDLLKAVLAILVKRCASGQRNIQRIIKIAFKFVGDPQYSALWGFSESVYKAYRELLQAARVIIASWINQRVLEYFFAKVQMDGGRRAFWYKYAPYMSAIRIAMHPGFSFGLAINDNSEVESWLKARLVKIKNDTTDIGLIMEYKEWAIVEIGTHGNACYIYNRDNPIIQNLRSSVNDLSLLKRTSLPVLHEYNPYGEGRVIHNNGWEYNLRNILRNKMGLIV